MKLPLNYEDNTAELLCFGEKKQTMISIRLVSIFEVKGDESEKNGIWVKLNMKSYEINKIFRKFINYKKL